MTFVVKATVVSVVKLEAQISLVVHLERWREDKFYDRFGLEEEKVNNNYAVFIVYRPWKSHPHRHDLVSGNAVFLR